MNERVPFFVVISVVLNASAVSPLLAVSEPNAPDNGTMLKASRFESALETLKQQDFVPPGMSPGPGPLPARGIAYTATPEMQAELGRSLYLSYTESLEYNRAVFDWQLCSSRIIFWVILLLVFIGVLLSGLQFAKSFLLLRTRSNAEREEMRTELELSMKGIRISSSVLGLLILVTSLAFLYLYLVHVYPIEYVQSMPIRTAVDANSN